MVADLGLSWSGRERNRMFLSLESGRFVDVSYATGLDFVQDARSVASVDWDGDGRVDLVLKNRNAPRIRLLRNQATTENANWLQVNLRGNDQINRDAIGSTVTLHAGNQMFQQVLLAGDGFLCQSSKTMFFGLGENTVIDKLSVRWPNGRVENFLDEGETLEGNQRLRLEPLQAIEILAAPAPVALQAGKNEASNWGDVDRLPLLTKISLAELPLPAFDNPNRKVKDLAGKPVLVNFWSTTCAACLEEFGDFHENQRKLSKQGLQIVPMVTDGMDRHERARAILKGVGLAQNAGWADQRVETSLRILTEEVLYRAVDMPLPVSLLIDSRGQLVQIHIGRYPIGALMRDLKILRQLDSNSPDASAMAFGRRLAFRDRNYAEMAAKFRAAGMTEMAEYFDSLIGRYTPGR